MRRAVILLAFVMALVVMSGPVAEVLDMPSPQAEAKKKKKKKRSRTAPNPYVQLLPARNGIWFEPPAPEDGIFGICQLYEFRAPFGYGALQRFSYPLDWAGNCSFSRPFAPERGIAWSVSGNVLVTQTVTGGGEVIYLGAYDPNSDALPIYRPSSGRGSVWYGCAATQLC